MLDYSLALLAGFTFGRLGHIMGGGIAWVPHHWIFGLIIIIVSLILIFVKKNKYLAVILLAIGIGIFVSDFNDFLLLKVWGADDVTILKFWALD